MNFILDNWYLFLVAIGSATALFWPVLSGGGLGALTIAQAVTLMNKEKAVVVDVRSTAEFASGTVAGAKNLPVAELPDRLALVVKNKDLPLIFICATGTRSQGAASRARRMGYTKAQSIAGGMAAWHTASMPIQKA